MTIETRSEALLYLGFTADQQPSTKEIHASYLREALRHHPDKSQADSTVFLNIQAAYRLLTEELPDITCYTLKCIVDDKRQNYEFKVKIRDKSEIPSLCNAISKNITSFSRARELRILESNFISAAKAAVWHELLKNPFLLKVSYPLDFFSNEQLFYLKKRLKINNTVRNLLRVFLGTLIGATLGCLAPVFSGKGIMTVLWMLTTGGVSGYLTTKAHEAYLKLCRDRYAEQRNKTKPFACKEQEDAFRVGLKVKTFRDYFKCFADKVTYQYPFAFGAGLFYAFEPKLKEKETKTIHQENRQKAICFKENTLPKCI